MPIDISNSVQAGRAIATTKRSVQELHNLRLSINDFLLQANINGFSTAFTAPGATFPAPYSLSPADCNAVITVMTALKTILDTNLQGATLASLERVRLDLV